jgi:hypothetical protein
MLCGETSQAAHRHKNCWWLSEFRTCVVSCNLQAVLRQVHSLFQSEFSTKYDLVLPLLISNSPIFSLRSPSSFLRLLPRLPVTSILPSMFPSITCLRRQFVHKMLTMQFHHKITQALSRSYKVPERVMRIKIRQSEAQNRECKRLDLHFFVTTKAKCDKVWSALCQPWTDRVYVCDSYTQV